LSLPHSPTRRAAIALLLGLPLVVALAGLGHADTVKLVEPAQRQAPEATPNEDQLLLTLCRYLKLSRSQIAKLVPVARWTERARAPWEREEAERKRAIEQLPKEQSAELSKQLQERRAQVTGEVGAFAASQLVRLFTREQILLAWRLDHGRLPKSAGEYQSLLSNGAGFSSQQSGRVYDFSLADLTLSREVLGESMRVAEVQAGALALAERATAAIREAEVRAGAVRSSPAAGRLLRLQEGQAEAQPKDIRPFPQIVVETSDLRELLPAVEPLARRLFMSGRWLEVLEDAGKNGLQVTASRSHLGAMGPLRLLRDYRMEQGFRDLAGRGPELEPMGGAINNGTYQFGAGQGLRLENAGVSDHYAVQLTFRSIAKDDGYRKILDFKNGSADGGLYLYKGQVTFYTLAVGGTPIPGQEHRIRLRVYGHRRRRDLR
jgi:hypothetical protein